MGTSETAANTPAGLDGPCGYVQNSYNLTKRASAYGFSNPEIHIECFAVTHWQCVVWLLRSARSCVTLAAAVARCHHIECAVWFLD